MLVFLSRGNFGINAAESLFSGRHGRNFRSTEMKSGIQLGDPHRVFVLHVWPPSVPTKRSLAVSRNGIPTWLIDSNLPESHYHGKKVAVRFHNVYRYSTLA